MADQPIALYDVNCELQAWWIGDNLWVNDSMRWLGYIIDGHVFRSDDNRWLGPVGDHVILDTRGRVVLWANEVTPSGASHVYRPARPSRPPRPETPYHPNLPPRPGKPPAPSGGWSSHSFKQWVRFKDEGPQSDEDRGIGLDFGMISFEE